MENRENPHSWLFGLEKFFQFRDDKLKYEFIRYLIQLVYYKPEDRPWALKKLFALDSKFFPDEERDNRWNVYTEIMIKENYSPHSVFWAMHTIWKNDRLINSLYLLFNNVDSAIVNDLFSKTQVMSKIWMAESIRKFASKPMNILLIGGWYGQHRWYLKDTSIKSITNIDLDEKATSVSKAIAEADNEPYYTVTGDATILLKEDGTIDINGDNKTFDLIINTSAEHMDTSWFDKLIDGQAVLVQSNNMYGMDGHINCVGSLGEFTRKYPLKRVYTLGQLALSQGNRFMTYGLK